MAIDRESLMVSSLREMTLAALALVAEKQRLQQAQTRIAEINATVADIQDEAQTMLDRFNALKGTAYTLAELRRRFGPPGTT